MAIVIREMKMKIKMKIKLLLQSTVLMLVCFHVNASVQNVSVQALFTDKAMVSIDGQSRLLVAGKASPEGVMLVSATSELAVLRINGKQSNYSLSSEVGTSFSTSTEVVEQLFSDEMGMYSSAGSINNHSVDFVVDTGASLIAMNEQQAKRLGIDFRLTGKPGQVATASDIESAYQVKLNTVKLGKIMLRNVDAVVLEGTHPNPALLGMSFLGRLKMESNGKAMVLKYRP